MTDIGVSAYRFSIAWPRIIPEGTGSINQRGLDFYDRLLDRLLADGITPYPTLYHWDLPQALEDRGGWYDRGIADAFELYVEAVARRLGDRIGSWITINEPWVQAWLGYGDTVHAPGRGDGDSGSVVAGHNLLRAHGRAVEVLRRLTPAAKVGITLDFSTIYAASDSEADRKASELADARKNAWFLDPVARGSYPELAADLIRMLPESAEQDMKQIAAPIDFMGVNYYSRTVIRSGESGIPMQVRMEGVPRMDSDWEIFPEGLRSLLIRLGAEYSLPSIFVMENGAAFNDAPGTDGRVRDERRTEYLSQHIQAVSDAIGEGAPVHGYFVWSLMDNFEWGSAYDNNTRFGIVYVDFETQQRFLKDSAHWYRSLIVAREAAGSQGSAPV
jgi:beta-glucosidase